MNLIKRYLTNNDCYKANKTITVKGLMIHSIGTPQPKATVIMNTWNKPAVKKCVQGFIEPDGDVYLTLPCDEVKGRAMRGWHGGKSGSNDNYIGFEMTEPSSIKYIGGASYVDNSPEVTRDHVKGTYTTAVELFAYLCNFHGLDPMKDGVILSHSEGYKRGIASNHGDVEHLWNKYGYSMQQFRIDIKNAMGTSPVVKPIPQPEPEEGIVEAKEFRVRVTANALNYRNGPSILHKINGTIRDKGVYTIVEQSNGWGKLKSGAGWISLKYTKVI